MIFFLNVKKLRTLSPEGQTEQRMLQLGELGGGCAMKFGLPAPHPLWSLCCKLKDFLAPRGASASVLEADELPFWRRHSYCSLVFFFLAFVLYVVAVSFLFILSFF